ncbi:unnamed protein product [Dovyalis caffra]|uniref:Major facilitator superfamily (MFS) profile domain-containing protein n=1 Tax=Dovyalis caffra TaxID=77055 RepID=A0AAV1QY54_9ROSI|nr:unnamed protein product [Dovyalis caffra]
MAETTVVPPQSEFADAEITRLDNKLPSLDEVIEHLTGAFGRTQLLQCILVSLTRVFDGQQTFISVFTDAEPTWHCIDNATCKSDSNFCNLSASEWAWDGTSSKTIISEWSLQCASSFIRGLPASSFFLGCIFGGFALASLADASLGRKKLLLLSCITMSFTALATIFSTNIWIYSTLRFITGVGRASIGTCSLVLLTENVGKRWRGRASILGFVFFTLGYLSLPAIAYINRGSSWRALYLCTSIPTILYCAVVYFCVSESPKWLFTQGREEEALAILKGFTSVNDGSLSLCLLSVPIKQNTISHDLYSTFKAILKKRRVLQQLLALMVIGFGIGMVYFGMPLGVGNMGFNIYLGALFNALLEVPSYFITFFVIDRCNRKGALLGFSILSGIFSILCFVVGDFRKEIKMGLELASLFGACMAYNVLLIYTTELFPTRIRNSATSMVRQALAFGAVFSPSLISAGKINGFLSYGVFGIVISLCGLFATCLPETQGSMLYDTVDEQEESATIKEDNSA